MSRFSSLTNEQWIEEFRSFHKKYGAPQPEPVRVLNLIMRKPFAEEILRGEKRVEIRAFSDHYYNRLTDKKVDKWIDENRGKEGMDMEAFNEFPCATRPVDRIHFHNYNNSWYLDVEVSESGLIALTDERVDDLRERFGFHELDAVLEACKKAEASVAGDVVSRPLFYYFAIGKVIGTSLKV